MCRLFVYLTLLFAIAAQLSCRARVECRQRALR